MISDVLHTGEHDGRAFLCAMPPARYQPTFVFSTFWPISAYELFFGMDVFETDQT
jgi:hypothetical protein